MPCPVYKLAFFNILLESKENLLKASVRWAELMQFSLVAAAVHGFRESVVVFTG